MTIKTHMELRIYDYIKLFMNILFSFIWDIHFFIKNNLIIRYEEIIKLVFIVVLIIRWHTY